MEFLMDPSIWAGLLTLVVLEIVLGIDNLVFIAILADKLPPKQRDKARLLGLSLALIMRLGLLSLISWMVTLTKPLFTVMDFSFSGRDLIMLFGGIFLLFKATTELHERLENRDHDSGHGKGYASFWVVVTQIVILDAVFSLDAVITAVGMVNHLPVMMAAVVIAMAVMLLASKPLTRFVNQHPTVVVLCLSFLLMIGLSLVAEGFGFHIPKGYLYAAIGFSIIIEVFNQIARRNFIRHQSTLPLRARTADALDPINLLGVLRRARGSFVIVTNEFGVVQGLVTPLDVLEAIAGEFPDADETPEIITDGDGWLVKGGTDLHALQQALDVEHLADDDDIATVAGLVISANGHIPRVGDVIDVGPLHITIIEANDYRVDLVRIVKEQPAHDEDE